MDLYAKNEDFKFYLNKLLKAIVPEQGSKIGVGEWFETVLDAFGSCVGHPSRLDTGLNALRAKRGSDLTQPEKDNIYLLGMVLGQQGILSYCDPSQSYSSDVPESTSDGIAARAPPRKWGLSRQRLGL